VVRIGKNGKEVWRTIIPGLSQGRDEARAIVRDPQDGNVIVAGRVRVAAGVAFAVFKLDAGTGAMLWPATMSEFPSGTANALSLTSRGTVAVAGAVDGQFAVLEFDTTTGAIVSRATLPGSGEALSVASDPTEGTVVAGGSVRSAQLSLPEMAVAKFDRTGQVIWSLPHMGFASFGDASVTVAVHEETGEIAAVGGTLSATFTAILLDSHGQEQWRHDDIQGSAKSIAFAGTDVVASGSVREGNSNLFAVVAWAHDGTEQWRRAFRGTADFAGDSAARLVVKDRNIFAAGVITNDLTYRDIFAVGLSSGGDDLPGAAVG
jgi:outer membrane protein assembly factor BamB